MILLGLVVASLVAVVVLSGSGGSSSWGEVVKTRNGGEGEEDPLSSMTSTRATPTSRGSSVVLNTNGGGGGVIPTNNNDKGLAEDGLDGDPDIIGVGGDEETQSSNVVGEGEVGTATAATGISSSWNAAEFDDSLWRLHGDRVGKSVAYTPGQIPTEPYIPPRNASSTKTAITKYGADGGSGVYATTIAEMVKRMEMQWSSSRNKQHPSSRPFRFHIYRVPDKFITEAFAKLETNWATSICNKKKTNYTMLDWRHAHSLFTADVLMTKYLRFHPHHTDDPDEADIFIIPMMTHVYNCAHMLGFATEILSWVVQFPYYKRYDNHDHFIFWWRWGMHYNSVQRFWKRVQRYIPKANIISFDFLEIMGRNQWQDFSLALKPKFDTVSDGIVMPYPDYSPVLSIPIPATEIHNPRPIFFYFAGTSTIGGIRRWIKRNCEMHTKLSKSSSSMCLFADFGTSVVDFARAGIPKDYPSQMKKSLFCGHAAGDALSSRRPTSAVLAGCIPVLICDLCIYAWEQVIDYGSFAVFMKEEDVLNGKMMSILEAIPPQEIKRMQANLVLVRRRFQYRIDGPPTEGDALDTLVSELSLRGRKLRSYRRWWTANHALSVEGRDYPVEPTPSKRYLQQRSWWNPSAAERAKEEKNFNNM